MPRRLTRQQVEFFTENGFLSPVSVLSGEEAAQCRREYELLEISLGGALKGIARTKFYLRHPFACRLATHPAILDAVEDLIGPDILLYQNTAWVKEAGEKFLCQLASGQYLFRPRPLPGGQRLGGADAVTAGIGLNAVPAGFAQAGTVAGANRRVRREHAVERSGGTIRCA